MARKKQTLSDWIHEALTDMDKGDTCSVMTLVHVMGAASEKEIHTIKFTPGGKQWTSKELEDLFDRKATSYAQDLPGTQLFTIHAFYGNPPPSQPQASHPFRINGEQFYEGTAQTEGPTGSGLVQQAMRHTEAMTQMAFRSVSETNALLMQMNQQLAQDAISLRKENSEAINIVKKLVLDHVKEQDELAMNRMRFQRNSDLINKLVSFMPAFANTITGTEVFPLSQEDTALIEGLLTRLDKDKMQKLAGLLPPEVAGPFLNRAERFLREREEKRKADEEALAHQDPIKELTE